MRLFSAEMEVRKEQRQRYFENPSYRKWSDVVSASHYGPYMDYEGVPDESFFIYYLFGEVEKLSKTPQEIREQLDKGHELPINWKSFYAYFEERFYDPANGYKQQLNEHTYYTAGCNDDVTVMQLLEEYRDFLLNPIYDMV